MRAVLSPVLLALVGSLLTSTSAPAQTELPRFLFGSPSSLSDSTRTITLTTETRWINAMHGESVRFIAGSDEFAWKFDGPGNRSFDLRMIAPMGALSHPVTVFVAPQPDRQ